MTQAAYKQIGREEFENVLSQFGEFRTVKVGGTKEIVYHVETANDDVEIRVYSSMTHDGVARGSGGDSIKIVPWDCNVDRPMGSTTRTNRIQTWAKNFGRKMDEMMDRVEDGDLTPESDPVEALESLPFAEGEDGEILVADIVDTKFGKKAVLETPYEAKDDVKSLDWDETHRAWDPAIKAWTVDVESIGFTASELSPEWTLVQEDPEAEEDGWTESKADSLSEIVEEGDKVEVVYTPKNGGDSKEVELEITTTRLGKVMGRRTSDGHTMLITGEGLFTTGSHFPFVGTPEDVQLA